MKRILSLLITLSLMAFASCGGGSSSDGGGTPSGPETGAHVTEAKEVAVSGAYMAIQSTLVASQIPFMTIFVAVFPNLPAASGSGDYSSDYSNNGGGADDAISGSYAYSYTGTNYEQGITLTYPQNNPVTHTSTLVDFPVSNFTLPDSSTAYSTTMSTSGSNHLTGKVYGSATLTATVSGGEPTITFTNMSLTGSELSVTGMTVKLSDNSEGTISFTNQGVLATVSGETFSTGVTNMSSTVVYGGETYTCTISATRDASNVMGGQSQETFTVSAAHCTTS